MQLDPDTPHMTSCPTLFWEVDGCHFILCKLPGDKFHCQFFYRNNKQFGTGIHQYNDLLDCLVALLRVQADHETKEKNTDDAG